MHEDIDQPKGARGPTRGTCSSSRSMRVSMGERVLSMEGRVCPRGDSREHGLSWARTYEKGQAQGRRVDAEAQLVGATRRDGRAEDECRLRVL